MLSFKKGRVRVAEASRILLESVNCRVISFQRTERWCCR